MPMHSFPSSRSGRRAGLTLRKVALLSFMVSTQFSNPVMGDPGLMAELLEDMEHALGINSASSRCSDSASASASRSISTSTPRTVATSATRSVSVPTSISTSVSRAVSVPRVSSTLRATSVPTSLKSTTSLSATTKVSTVASATPTLPTTAPAPTTTTGSSTQPRAVFAHVIVGNTYNYTVSTWANDIALAASKGIDAFALNVGSDSWEPGQIANAYAAAGQYNAKVNVNTTATTNSTAANATVSTAPPFKLFLSFDMSSLPCSGAGDAQQLQTYIKTYANNTSQFRYNGRMLVSTFAGESCTFGASGLNQAWINAVKPVDGSLPGVWFVPSFFVDPQTFPGLSVIDGAFHWNSGWPMGNYNVSFAPDTSYISNLSGSRTYMAAVSPWFFTHYGPDTYNKNFIYRGDDWLFAQRWEMLVQNRTSVPLVEAVTWNDFGESHYLGPIEGIQPMSQAWVNGYDHQGWLDLMQYYITAYKTGSYPTITKDRVFLWARLAPANASAPDPVGKPTNYQWTQDYLWAVTQLTAPANVTLSCGSTTQTTLVPAGLGKLKLKLSANCAAQAVVARGAKTALSFAPAGFNFRTSPSSYNFNAFVAASPA